MQNLDNIQRVVTWRTHKGGDGWYVATVVSMDHAVPSVIHYTGFRATRPAAVTLAKQAARYIKAQQRKEATQ